MAKEEVKIGTMSIDGLEGMDEIISVQIKDHELAASEFNTSTLLRDIARAGVNWAAYQYASTEARIDKEEDDAKAQDRDLNVNFVAVLEKNLETIEEVFYRCNEAYNKLNRSSSTYNRVGFDGKRYNSLNKHYVETKKAATDALLNRETTGRSGGMSESELDERRARRERRRVEAALATEEAMKEEAAS